MEQLRQALAQLQTLLQNNNMKALDVLAQLQEQLAADTLPAGLAEAMASSTSVPRRAYLTEFLQRKGSA
jgi:hypothetical protein